MNSFLFWVCFDGASEGEREGLTGGRARAMDMEKAKECY
jgi:hypothetical protein